MNKARRKEIAKAVSLMEQARAILEEVRDDEQDDYENMIEALQNGERGEQSLGYIDALDASIDNLENDVGELIRD
jgi:hypothetical protein